jgi:hypothetical protein
VQKQIVLGPKIIKPVNDSGNHWIDKNQIVIPEEASPIVKRPLTPLRMNKNA